MRERRRAAGRHLGGELGLLVNRVINLELGVLVVLRLSLGGVGCLVGHSR